MARALFQRFVELVESCGPVTAAPAKTRVAFMVRVRFASVNALSDRGLRGHFVLPYSIQSPRIKKVEHLQPWYVHSFSVSHHEELDEELRQWLCAAYHLMGTQEF